MRWAIRLVMATVVGLATIVVAFDASSLRESTKYQPPKGLVLSSIIALGVGVVYQYADAALERRRNRRRIETGALISTVAFPFWADLTELFTDLAVQRSFGLHVWMVPSWHWNVVPDRLRRLVSKAVRDRLPTPEMWRAARFRLDSVDNPTNIAWRRDVGVIGACWRTRQVAFIDLDQQWGPDELDEPEFSALSRTQTLGLSYNQYFALREKYRAALAIPIFKNADNSNKASQFIGCVVIDCLRAHPALLNDKPIRTPVWQAARKISQELAKMR